MRNLQLKEKRFQKDGCGAMNVNSINSLAEMNRVPSAFTLTIEKERGHMKGKIKESIKNQIGFVIVTYNRK